MIELYAPRSEGELLILRSILDDAGIPHFVLNDAFGSLVAGPRIALYNGKRILVHEIDLPEARSLVGEYLARTGGARSPIPAPYRFRDKLRMVAEFLLFGWFLPGRRYRAAPPLRLVKGFRVSPREPADR